MTTNNHPAHGPVSLDRLHQIREILSKAVVQSDGGNLGCAMADAVKVIEVAIASFGAEPVEFLPSNLDRALTILGVALPISKEEFNLDAERWMQRLINRVIRLESELTSPAPVVPEWTNEQCLEFLSIAFRHAEIKGDLELDDIRLGMKMVNESRAAMLQGTDGKPELTVWYGSMPETNGKTNWTAMLHRKGQHPWEGITIDRSEYPDRVRYEADRMRHLIGELADEPDILAYDADAHSGYVNPGNSPVTPDGWKVEAERLAELHGCSFVVFRHGEEPQCSDPTKVIISFTDEGLGHHSAAPQHEV